VIVCDHFLEVVFNCKRMRFMEIPQRLQPLLQQPDPLVLNHTIRYEHGGSGAAVAAGAGGMVDGTGGGKNTACYDIDVEMDDPTKMQMSAFVQSHNSMPDIAALDHKVGWRVGRLREGPTRHMTRIKICELVEQINDHKTRRDFYTRFSNDPQKFVQEWLVSQSRDLKVGGGGGVDE